MAPFSPAFPERVLPTEDAWAAELLALDDRGVERALRDLLASLGAMSLDEAGCGQASVLVAHALLRLIRSLSTHAEQRQNRLLSRRMDDRPGQLFATQLTDRAPRLQRSRDLTQQAIRTLRATGIPGSMPVVDRLSLWGLNTFGAHLPAIIAPLIRRRIRREAAPFLAPGSTARLQKELRRLQGRGFAVNVNLLGEEVLGAREAQHHLDEYLRLLAIPEVRTISVKVSSICAQLDVLSFEDSLARVAQALTLLYRAAMTGGTGATVPSAAACGNAKLVMLDMESYRDLEITCTAFMRVLSQPEFRRLRAGIVLQAYIPDSHRWQAEVLRWASARIHEGGAPIAMRIVKGANLALERVESSMRNLPVPIYPRKELVDASFKKMIRFALSDATQHGTTLGIASHNLFDIAYALVLRHGRRIPGAHAEVPSSATVAEEIPSCEPHFEVLAGMAGALGRTLLRLGEHVLLYTAAVREQNRHAAIAYLVRRLDENTAKENFLRHSFAMEPGDGAWCGQRDGFLTSCRLQDSLPTESLREPGAALPLNGNESTHSDSVNANTSSPHSSPMAFANAIDTDFEQASHRRTIAAAIDQLRDAEPGCLSSFLVDDGENVLTPGASPVQNGPQAEGFDPSRPGYLPYTFELAAAQDVERALVGGCAAQARWSAITVAERCALLRRIGDELERRRCELVATLLLDGGKAVRDGDAEVSEAIDFARYYAACWEELSASTVVQARPRGLTVVVAPWNFPLAIPLGGVFAALVAGNSVILKPALQTLLIATRAVEICYAAGVPREALQLVAAEDAVATALVTDERVQTVVLTGGTATAEHFLRLRPRLRLCAETGGKNATIVTRFADQDLAIKSVVASAFGHAGQKCSATSLLILPPEFGEGSRFQAQLVDAAETLRVGSAWELASQVTPMIEAPTGDLQRALCSLEPGESWWLEPRQDEQNPRLWSPGIKAGVKRGSFAHQREFFGPMLSVMVADSLEEAIAIANDTPYGLTAGLHSLDGEEQRIFLDTMNGGNLYINRGTTGAIVRRQPFGGRKASCFGPGAKAGGPNYVAMFAHLEDAPRKSIGAGNGDGNLLQPRLAQALAMDPSFLRDQLADYGAALRTHFAMHHDPSQIRGQDNIFRYQNHQRMLLVIFAGATPVEASRMILAATQCRIPFSLLLANIGTAHAAAMPTANAAPDSQEGACARLSPASHAALGELFADHLIGEESALAKLETGYFPRVRLCGAPAAENASGVPLVPVGVHNRGSAGDDSRQLARLFRAAPCGVYFDSSPFLAAGRYELGKYLVEQSLSVDYHRYGYLGARENTDGSVRSVDTLEIYGQALKL